MLLAIRRRFAAIFDAIDSPSVRRRLEKLVVAGAAIGFLVHLGVIGVAHYLPHLPETVFKGLDESPLHAVYTPFSVILFYEVLLLVFALAASHTGEIAKQYQIISLIVVRRVFKDIGSFSELENWLAEPEAVRAVHSPELKPALASEGAEPVGNTPQQFAAIIRSETQRIAQVVRKAGIMCGDRYAWMHLGRHDEVVSALDEIEALDLPEHLKEQLRDDLATFIGWRSGREMLKIYGAHHFAARKAATTIAWQDGRSRSAAPTSSFDMAPELAAAFAGR